MAEDCIFISVLGKCPPKQQLSQSRPDGARLRHIINASIRYGDSLHIDIQQKLDLDKNLQVYYHKNCISTYQTCAPASTPSHVDGPLPKRTRSSDVPAFNFREHCIYCGERCLIERDKKNLNRWVPAYLVKEVETKEVDEKGKPVKIKDKILKQCKVRADNWVDMVKARVVGSSSDLHASDTRYHKDCLSRFFSQRNAPGESKGAHDDEQEDTPQLTGLRQLITEMQADRTKIWDSVGLQERFTELVGSSIRRADLLKMLSRDVDDIVILSAPGYGKVVMFCDNARATLKVTKDDADEDDIDDTLHMIARVIKAEVCETEYEKNMYTRKISKSVAAESVSGTLQLLLHKLSPSLNADSLTSLLIGNMVTSVLGRHATPLQIALGVLMHRKKIIQHMYDYNVTCSYDELRRYKKYSAVARYTKLKRGESSCVC